MLTYLRDRGLSCCEPTKEAEDKWTEEVYADFARTLLAEANAWWVKVTNKPDGTVLRRTLVHVGGGPEYRRRCEEVAYCDYVGFALS